MREHLRVGDAARAPSTDEGSLHELLPDLAYQRLGIVNVVCVGAPGRRGDGARAGWTLVDAGVPGSRRAILGAVMRRFGEDPPEAIVLTHAHFDHVGALPELLERWDVPLYAHQLEHPYLDGRRSYPPPDPTVGGGAMAALSPLYPKGPIDVRRWLRPLPADGTVPTMPDWRWIHTPGHTPGHVALWRARDKTLLSGDAFITTDQESAYAVAVQRPEIHGPPAYFTPDWDGAEESVRRLAELRPERVVSGHGPPLAGPEMRAGLEELAHRFRQIAVPEHGRYVMEGRDSEA